MHAKIENGQIVEWPIVNLRQYFPNTSLPADLTNQAGLPEGFVYVKLLPPPTIDATVEKLVENFPVFVDGVWQYGYDVVPLSEAEMAEEKRMHNENAAMQRKQAYMEESDPLFFKWQRDEGTKQAWLDKIAEIAQRYPYQL